jgi:hypothetical protein
LVLLNPLCIFGLLIIFSRIKKNIMNKNVFLINSRFPGFFSGLAIMYLLASCNVSPAGTNQRVTFKQLEAENRVEVFFDDELFTAYIFPEDIPKPILYPLNAANGTTLTRGFPIEPRPGERVDHPHQVGHWFNYGDVNGLDFWNNRGNVSEDRKDRFGYIEHHDITGVKEGRNKGILEVSALWKNYDNNVLLNEKTSFSFSVDGNTRIIDRVTTLTANDDDVSFTDNKEGMIAIRVARELEIPNDRPGVFVDANGNPVRMETVDNKGVNGNYLSSEGITGNDVWSTRARWVLLHGVMDQENVALAIIDHPENVGYPTYWHARGYGLFSANPLGQKEFSDGRDILNFKLPAGESVTFKYRILVHSGELLSGENINKFADDFARLR